MVPYIHVVARGLLFTPENQVLLYHNLKTGAYGLPGGHLEVGETLHQALVREFQEECGLMLSPGTLCNIFQQQYATAQGVLRHEIVFLYKVPYDASQKIQQQEEHIKPLWVPLDSLATLDLRPPFLGDLIMQARHGQPENVSQLSIAQNLLRF